MDPQDDLTRYETTEAQELLRLFNTLRAPPVEHAPAHFRAQVLARVAQRQAPRRWWAWLRPGWTAPWIPALATGLLVSVGLNTWLGLQVLERHPSGVLSAVSERAASAPRPGEEEPGGPPITVRGWSPREAPGSAVQLASEGEGVRALTALAGRYYHAGQYARSLTVASAALTLDPNAARALFYRGMASDGLGNRPQAIEDVRRAAHLGDPEADAVLRAWGVD